jgi:hypothetical protein
LLGIIHAQLFCVEQSVQQTNVPNKETEWATLLSPTPEFSRREAGIA